MVSNVQQPELTLRSADLRKVADLLSATADLTLVLGDDDVISDLTHSLRQPTAAEIGRWRGRPIADVVARESRPALEAMLASARDGRASSRFDVTHALSCGADLAVRYSAFHIVGDGQVILVGRDLRPFADLESQLIDQRRSLDASALRYRQAEARYRALFETGSDAMLIVDPETAKIRDANPRAARLVGGRRSGAPDLVGRSVASLFARRHQAAIQAAIAKIAAAGEAPFLSFETTDRERMISIDAELFRAGDETLVMMRLSAGDGAARAVDDGFGDLVRHAAEAVLITDEAGRALWVNESFLAMTGLPLAANAVGRSLGSFFAWTGPQENAILADARKRGQVPMLAATLLGAHHQTSEVELSIVLRQEAAGRPGAVGPGGTSGFALVIRRRAETPAAAGPGFGNSDLSRAAEALAEMVGRVPMKDMVRETTDVVERMCIEAALKLTGDNRASAARILGLSRQALYLKMHRFGLGGEE